MSMTFYDYPGAPSPRRARIALIEKGAAFDTVTVDLARNEQLSDEFRAINPLCTVPALRLDDGTVLGDNHGILAYLEATFPEPPLLGSTPLEKAEIASWAARVEFEGLLAVAEVLRNMAPQMKGRALTGPVDYDQIPELAARGARRLEAFWDVLEERLEGREFLAADSFSAADIAALVTVDFSKVIRMRPNEDRAALWRWRRALDGRESVRSTNVG